MQLFRLAVAVALVSFTRAAAVEAPVDFSRDVRTILAGACYACHGPDEAQRKAKLRLDLREDAIKSAIVPGQSGKSPLIERITTKEADEVMPPPHAKKPAVTAAQVAVLKRWIDEGAKFDLHWAYVKPAAVNVPPTEDNGWAKNTIDSFIQVAHAREKYSPAPAADPVTLLRRLSFDLTGLPPTRADVDTFLKAFERNADNAIEQAVDRLLASPAFGERMAVMWLDVVRYADTGGYHSDNHRDVWMFRDYVINSFNGNKSFDKFTIEQIAGDLLPNPTSATRVASGYNRMLMTTEEGGAQAKEYTAKYSADRVRNTSNAWLGATLGCAECHNHKYDPYTQRDFYRFAAFFADVREKAVGRQDQTPIMEANREKQIASVDARLTELEAKLLVANTDWDAEQAKWEADLKIKKDGTKGFPKPVIDALTIEVSKRSAEQSKTVMLHFRTTVAAGTESIRKKLATIKSEKDSLMKGVPTTLISMTGPARVIRILPRGNWLDDSGEPLTPDVPAFMGSVAPVDPKARATRMDLAKWMVAPENPLTARVFVNRLWKIAFGQGLVRNLDDLGLQGTLPSHPQLLDALANDFVLTGWDVKRMLKLMVMSAAYRQSSVTSKETRDRDPGNTWLARQNRFRLDAEFVRDNALAVSGLLTTKVGGPSARPYQPAGFWSYLNFPKREWQSDKGDDQYRRGLYTYWCRSFLHPSLFAFDAPTREECTNERSRSSTPLQALVMLNDPTYVEASRVLAERIFKAKLGTPAEAAAWAFREVVSRSPTVAETAVLEQLYRKHQKEWAADKAGAGKLLSVGDHPLPADTDAVELAAWTSVARVLLNLHEAMVRN